MNPEKVFSHMPTPEPDGLPEKPLGNLETARMLINDACTEIEAKIIYEMPGLSAVSKKLILEKIESLDRDAGVAVLFSDHPYFKGETPEEQAKSWTRMTLRKEIEPMLTSAPERDLVPLQYILDELNKAASVYRPGLGIDY